MEFLLGNKPQFKRAALSLHVAALHATQFGLHCVQCVQCMQ
jgi:hypothetical protein